MNFIVTIIAIILLLRASFETDFADRSKFGTSASSQTSLEIALFTVLHGKEKRPGTVGTCGQSVKLFKLISKTGVPEKFRVDEFGKDKLCRKASIVI